MVHRFDSDSFSVITYRITADNIDRDMLSIIKDNQQDKIIER